MTEFWEKVMFNYICIDLYCY